MSSGLSREDNNNWLCLQVVPKGPSVQGQVSARKAPLVTTKNLCTKRSMTHGKVLTTSGSPRSTGAYTQKHENQSVSSLDYLPSTPIRSETMCTVNLQGITKTYGTNAVIEHIDLEVRDGEFMVFVGPSGCGKSTTLRMIAGLESITSGDLRIDGIRANELRPSQRGAAMVFQTYALYPHMTVADNMGFSLRMAGVPRAERRRQVARTAEVLRISHHLDHYPRQLSGGERQRVAIGRAIVRKPKVFLFDEPLSNLDAALRVDMRIELSRLHRELATTMIYVTHDQVEAMTMGDRIAVFNQGRIEQLGAPMELFNAPRTDFVAGFLGMPRMNMLDRPEAGVSATYIALWEALGGTNLTLARRIGVRPEHVKLCSPRDGVPGTVELVEHLGESSIIYLRLDGIQAVWAVSMQGPAALGHVHGQRVGIRVQTEFTHGFDDTGMRVSGMPGIPSR